MPPTLGDGPRHFLLPCTLFVRPEEYQITTILGSCIAVCLWDPGLRLGGINHFMLPLWNGEGLATPKYGNIAMEKLLERMLGMGCRKERLVAKLFGGARIIQGPSPQFNVGGRNLGVATSFLAQKGIAIAGSQVGGSTGLKIIFNNRTGSVLAGRLSPYPKGQPRPAKETPIPD